MSAVKCLKISALLEEVRSRLDVIFGLRGMKSGHGREAAALLGYNVGDGTGSDLVLCNAAGLHRLGDAESGRATLQLTGAACNALDQAVLVVEGILYRHAFHPVRRG